MTESRSANLRHANKVVKGEVALWEVAKMEGLEYCASNMEILLGLVEGCSNRPHPKPKLAAQGHLKKKDIYIYIYI